MALRAGLRSKGSAAPLVYVAPHHAADIDAMSFALSIPPSSFFVVPTVPHPASPSTLSSLYTLDAQHLRGLLAKHAQQKRTPTVLLLTLGSPISSSLVTSGYQSDDVDALTEVARPYGLWVHAEGTEVVESGEKPEDDAPPADSS